MEDLVRWLGTQLDEDEAVAEATLPLHLRVGRFRGKEIPRWRITKSGTGIIDEDGGTLRAQQIFPAEAAHVVRHDPARVLREIDAKRKLIARGGPFCTSDCDEPGNEPMDPEANWTTPLEHHLDCAAYKAAEVLALPYADRPDYREEWRP